MTGVNVVDPFPGTTKKLAIILQERKISQLSQNGPSVFNVEMAGIAVVIIIITIRW